MNYWHALGAAGLAVATGQTTFRLGQFSISATRADKPTHLSFAQALHAAEMALAGRPGTIQSGDVAIAVALWNAPSP